MPAEIWFESHYTDYGCSPQLLVKTINWLNRNKQNLVTFDLAMYLFNNNVLLDALIAIANAGCRVTVYSIPLEGYDKDNRADIYSFLNCNRIGRFTKYEIACEVYKRIRMLDNPNFEFRIVPHMFLRSPRVKPFSRGNMPYSLHCKTFLATLSNGVNYAGITSSNLAVRDEEKLELASVIALDANDTISAKDFFEGLRENSFPIRDFDETADYSHFQICMRTQPTGGNLKYTAPFYHDSSIAFETSIRSTIEAAEKRVIICAQHISAYNYSYEASFRSQQARAGYVREPGFLSAAIEKAKNRVGVFFLSQTYADATGSHECRKPKNTNAFIAFAEAARKSGCHYKVNDLLHSKYIVSDDTAIITTSNFTPTEFIYLPYVNIPVFENIPNYSYSGIHCEFGAYYVTRDSDFVQRLVEYSRVLWRSSRQMF